MATTILHPRQSNGLAGSRVLEALLHISMEDDLRATPQELRNKRYEKTPPQTKASTATGFNTEADDLT